MRNKSAIHFWGVLMLLAFGIFAACAQNQVLKTTPAEANAKAAPMAQKAVAEKHIEEDFSVSCLECHTTETPEVVQDWTSGMHGQVNVGCFVCHGDGEEEFYPQPTDDRCISCHSGYVSDLSAAKKELTCFSCHNGHTLRFHSPEAAPGFGDLLPLQLPRTAGL